MSTTATMCLGAFQLEEPIGQGGMGQVWRGRHTVQDVPVAMKVIATELARNERFRASFADEVRAVARLDHPSIVTVFDHGVIDAEAERQSNGQLVAGSPYMVMELCAGHSLRNLGVLHNYAELRVMLLQLLDALAHAHARGVVHRDIKPGNVMLAIDALGDHRLKLTDFGIARAAQDAPQGDPGNSSGTGTPGYMAPEQIVGDVMAQGPWTDLYAVGCLAFRLATGDVPYAAAGDDKAMLAAHLRHAVPDLRARFRCPPGFQRWLERMLHKSPHHRYLRAADAIWALLSLGDVPYTSIPAGDEDTFIDDHSSQFPPSASEHTHTTLALIEFDAISDEATFQDPETAPGVGVGDAPPIPSRYASVERAARKMTLVGAGLGLWGLRPIPLVGREHERALIWDALRTVATDATPQLVLVHGSSGYGKSRLVEWICQRAHELGSAFILRATHGPVPGPSYGVGPMLARYFDCVGAGREATLLQLRAMLGERPEMAQLALAVVELMAPETSPSETTRRVDRVRFASMEERYATVCALLEHLSQSRPVILWLDDVQWGADALALAEYILNRKQDLRVLLLATARDESGDERALERGRLTRLSHHPLTESIEVGALDERHHSELVQRLLGLEGELARRVEERTAGNPLFAVQLVGDWVRRGVLQAGDDGFCLRPGEDAKIPDDIHAMWNMRVEQLLDGFADRPSVQQSLELAAALGDQVDEVEWLEASGRMSLAPAPELVERMLESGLARRRSRGWAFCHVLLRESIARAASAAGRAQHQHRVCADMLRAHYGSDALPERVGHHLLAAGDHEAALDPLSVAAKRRFDRGDYDRALAIVLEREQALSAMMIGLQDKRWIEGWLLTVRAGLARNDYDAAEQVLQRAEQHAVDNYQVAEICLLHAEMCWHRAQMTEALELAESTQRQFRALGDRLGEADCRAIAAKCHLEGTGDFARALVEARAARKSYEDLSDRDRIAAAEYLESKILVEIGDLDGAERQCLAAELHHGAEGHRMGLAKCANQLGEIARLRRRLAEAESLYMKSLTLLEAMSSESATGVRVNLALVLVQRSLFGRALPMLRQLQNELTQAGMERAYGHIDYALLACLAAEKHWDAFDDQLALCGQWVPARGRVDKDYAALAEQAAGFASQVSDNERAGAALSLAIVHLDAIGKAEHASGLRERLVRLGTRRSDRAP